jgi:putative acetyltransferase
MALLLVAPPSVNSENRGGVMNFAVITAVTSQQCEHLVRESELYLATLYPPSSIYTVPATELEKTGNVLLGAFRAEANQTGGAIGCVGYMLDALEPDVAEIKRLFVSPGFRHLGVATQLMDALEERAVHNGIRVLRLETGVHQHESLGLYFARGYSQRSPFGGYLGDPYSVFLEKLLSRPHTP